MSLRSIVLIPLALLLFSVFLVYHVVQYSAQPAAASNTAAPPPPKPQTQPELIANPTEPPQLAEGPGQDVFLANCLNCHSPRYVLMQPRFPRKVWTAEVAKMVNAYKAPIAPEQQTQIVNYLVAAYGSEDRK